jgi:hypothetical protein
MEENSKYLFKKYVILLEKARCFCGLRASGPSVQGWTLFLDNPKVDNSSNNIVKWTSREILTIVKGIELEPRSIILSICRSAWLSKQHLNMKRSSKKLMKNSLLQSARQMHLHWEQLLLGDNPFYFQFCKSYPCRRWNRRTQ